MISTSQEWKTYSEDYSNYKPYILVTKGSTVVWEFDASHIQEGTLSFTDDISNIGGVNIGATPSNHFECDIINFDQTFPTPSTFDGCKARLYFFRGDQSTAIVGQAIVGQAIVGVEEQMDLDHILRGEYYLDPISSVGSTVHISGSDAMSLEEFNSSNMDDYSFEGKTCYAVIQEMGFNIASSSFPNANYVLPDVTCSEEFGLKGVSKRTVLGYIASICGCYARHNNSGVLELKTIGQDSTVTEVTKIMEEPDVDYYSVVISGCYVTGRNGCDGISGAEGYYFLVEDNPLVTTDADALAIATTIANVYTNLEIYPFSMSFIADPSMEAGDRIEFESNGRTIDTIVTSLAYKEGELSTCEATIDKETHATSETAVNSIGYVRAALSALYNGDTLKKIINLSGDLVKINAETIDLTGAVFVDGTINCNNTFTVDPQGNVVANSFSSNISSNSPITEQIRVTYNPLNSGDSNDDWVTAMRGGNIIVYNGENFANQVTIYPGQVHLAKNGSAEPSIKLEVSAPTESTAFGYIEATEVCGSPKLSVWAPRSGTSGWDVGCIEFKGLNNNWDMIRFYDNTNANYGHGIGIGGAGFLVIGSGESPRALEQVVSINSEETFICSDNGIFIEGGGNSAYTDRKGVYLNPDGHLCPVVGGAYSDNTRDLGSSAYRFRNVYSHQGWFGSESAEETVYLGTTNNSNNMYLAVNYGDNGQAGLFHRNSTGYGTNCWVTYISTSGAISRNTTSDRRVKDEVCEIPDSEASAVLNGVRPINFTYKKDDKRNIQSGIYAQDLRDTLQDHDIGYRGYLLIMDNHEEGESYYDLDHDEDEVTYGIDYSKLVSVLIKGWQMHEKKLKEQEDRIAELERKIEVLMEGIK